MLHTVHWTRIRLYEFVRFLITIHFRLFSFRLKLCAYHAYLGSVPGRKSTFKLISLLTIGDKCVSDSYEIHLQYFLYDQVKVSKKKFHILENLC
jgi:hypothetical protein